jgi:hypothetical protein
MTHPLLGTFVLTVVAVGLAMLALALGQLRGGHPLAGSCGGACGACEHGGKRGAGRLRGSARRCALGEEEER